MFSINSSFGVQLPEYDLPDPYPSGGVNIIPPQQRRANQEHLNNSLRLVNEQSGHLPLLFDEKSMPIEETFIRMSAIKQDDDENEEEEEEEKEEGIEEIDEDLDRNTGKPIAFSEIVPNPLPSGSCRMIFYGRPGMGKTTLSTMLCYGSSQRNSDAKIIQELWQWMGQFRGDFIANVYKISLRELKTFTSELDYDRFKEAGGRSNDRQLAYAVEFILRNVLKHVDHTPLGVDLEQQIVRFIDCLSRAKPPFLFLLDGYDELPAGIYSDDAVKNHNIIRGLTELPYFIITSRPEQVDLNLLRDLQDKVRFDERNHKLMLYEITGFNYEDAFIYIDNYCQYFTLPNGVTREEAVSRARSLKEYIKQNKQLRATIKVPICLELICRKWMEQPKRQVQEERKEQQDEQENPLTNMFDIPDINITQLYSGIVTYLLRRVLYDKHRFHEKRSDRQLFSIFRMPLKFLQGLAFDKVTSRERDLMIASDEVAEYIADFKDAAGDDIIPGHYRRNVNVLSDEEYFQEIVLELQILTKASGMVQVEEHGRADQPGSYEFIHMSFQEFLAACELVMQLSMEDPAGYSDGAGERKKSSEEDDESSTDEDDESSSDEEDVYVSPQENAKKFVRENKYNIYCQNVLGFAAGLLASEKCDFVWGGNSKNRARAAKAFWEAIREDQVFMTHAHVRLLAELQAFMGVANEIEIKRKNTMIFEDSLEEYAILDAKFSALLRRKNKKRIKEGGFEVFILRMTPAIIEACYPKILAVIQDLPKLFAEINSRNLAFATYIFRRYGRYCVPDSVLEEVLQKLVNGYESRRSYFISRAISGVYADSEVVKAHLLSLSKQYNNFDKDNKLMFLDVIARVALPTTYYTVGDEETGLYPIKEIILQSLKSDDDDILDVALYVVARVGHEILVAIPEVQSTLLGLILKPPQSTQVYDFSLSLALSKLGECIINDRVKQYLKQVFLFASHHKAIRQSFDAIAEHRLLDLVDEELISHLEFLLNVNHMPNIEVRQENGADAAYASINNEFNVVLIQDKSIQSRALWFDNRSIENRMRGNWNIVLCSLLKNLHKIVTPENQLRLVNIAFQYASMSKSSIRFNKDLKTAAIIALGELGAYAYSCSLDLSGNYSTSDRILLIGFMSSKKVNEAWYLFLVNELLNSEHSNSKLNNTIWYALAKFAYIPYNNDLLTRVCKGLRNGDYLGIRKNMCEVVKKLKLPVSFDERLVLDVMNRCLDQFTYADSKKRHPGRGRFRLSAKTLADYDVLVRLACFALFAQGYCSHADIVPKIVEYNAEVEDFIKSQEQGYDIYQNLFKSLVRWCKDNHNHRFLPRATHLLALLLKKMSLDVCVKIFDKDEVKQYRVCVANTHKRICDLDHELYGNVSRVYLESYPCSYFHNSSAESKLVDEDQATSVRGEATSYQSYEHNNISHDADEGAGGGWTMVKSR